MPMVAAWKGLAALSRALVAAGLNKKAKNKYGETPLSIAQLVGHTALVALFVVIGGGPGGADPQGCPGFRTL